MTSHDAEPQVGSPGSIDHSPGPINLQDIMALNPWVLLIVGAAGVVRGLTGFGGAMFMAPLLGLLLNPVVAVVYALGLEAVAAVTMLPAVWHLLNRPLLAVIALPAMLGIPVGGYLLVNLDPVVIRTVLSVTVMTFSILMLFGFRYHGQPRASTAGIVGVTSGLLFGATSMGGPPAIIYLLSGPWPHFVTRANLIAYISFASAFALVVPASSGHISLPTAAGLGIAVIPYLSGAWFGAQLFPLVNERIFRQLTLAFMFSVSTLALIF